MSPPSNSLVPPDHLNEPSTFYPLRVFVCNACGLVQLPEYQSPTDTFSEYPYSSSYSSTWVKHVRRYVRMMCDRLKLNGSSLVVEIASNDGSLLRGFQEQGINVLGIEPARNVAAKAQADGVPTINEFFGLQLGHMLTAEGKSADLVVANNVLAHVPDLNNFVEGIHELLKPTAIATLEFPHLVKLVEKTEFDTIYHEHLSYFSLLCVARIFEAHGLRIFDVEEIPTHGGSLRIFVAHAEARLATTAAFDRLLESERAAGYETEVPYHDFERRVRECKQRFLSFLIDAATRGERVVGYGAPAKATTLLNYCGAGTDLIEFTVDRNPYKQGKFIPGVRVPIEAPSKIFESKAPFVIIFPWNIREEIMGELAGIRSWGGKFVVPVPTTKILD